MVKLFLLIFLCAMSHKHHHAFARVVDRREKM
jgi:hypothetical protein